MSKDYIPLLCKDCTTEIFVDRNMVMIKDDLWKKIADKHEDAYCDCCIEKRLGRKIAEEDFEPVTHDYFGFGIIPCNAWWLEEQKLKNGEI